MSKDKIKEFQVDLKNWSQWLTIFNHREGTQLCKRLQQDNRQATVTNGCSTTAGEPPTPKTNTEAQLHFELNKGKEGHYLCRGNELEGL